MKTSRWPLVMGVLFAVRAMAASGAEDIDTLRKRAEAGDESAQKKFYLCYVGGEGTAKDRPDAVKWCRKFVERGDDDMMLLLYCYTPRKSEAKNQGGTVPVWDSRAECMKLPEIVKWLQRAAEQGVVSAQCCLGLCYARSDGVPYWGIPRDMVEAAKWYRKAAEQGDTLAQMQLGRCYANGEGVPKDEVEALAWFNVAVSSGSEAAKEYANIERRLGADNTLKSQERSKELLQTVKKPSSGYEAVSQNIPKDLATADKWYRNAAEQAAPVYNQSFTGLPTGGARSKGPAMSKGDAEKGDAEAQLNLAFCYALGKSVRRDSFEAAKWFRKSALQWQTTAQLNLGLCYTTGEGVPKDEAEALVWMNIAAFCGNKDAVEWRDLLEARLGSDISVLAKKRSETLRETMSTGK